MFGGKSEGIEEELKGGQVFRIQLRVILVQRHYSMYEYSTKCENKIKQKLKGKIET